MKGERDGNIKGWNGRGVRNGGWRNEGGGMEGGMRDGGWWPVVAALVPDLGQESLDHQVHAAHIEVHGEVPVLLLTVQDGAMVHEAESQVRACNPWLLRFPLLSPHRIVLFYEPCPAVPRVDPSPVMPEMGF